MCFFQHPKFGIQIRLENSMKIFIFCSKFFFRTPLKFFSWVQHGCSRYLKGVFYLQVYVEKRMKVIQHIDKNIFGKNYPPKNCFWRGWQSQWIFNLIWRDVNRISDFRRILKQIGIQLSTREFYSVWLTLDRDRGGDISFEEWFKWLKK